MRASPVREHGTVVARDGKVTTHDRQIEFEHFAQFKHYSRSLRQLSQTNAECGPELLSPLSCIDLFSRIM